MKVMTFAAGLAAGYVLGSRAGREKYEQIVVGARKVGDHPMVVQAQEKVKGLLGATTETPPAIAATEAPPAVSTAPEYDELSPVAHPTPTRASRRKVVSTETAAVITENATGTALS